MDIFLLINYIIFYFLSEKYLFDMFKVGKIIFIYKKCDCIKYIDSNVYSLFYILYFLKYNYIRIRV